MKIFALILYAVFAFVESQAHAYGMDKHVAPIFGDAGPIGSLTIGVDYGTGFINPSDLNYISSNQPSIPTLASINRSTYYGGFLGYRFLPQFDVQVIYQVETATNVTSTTMGPSTGYTLFQNEIWLVPNYYFYLSSAFYSYVGAGVGYPVYSHVSESLFVKNEYDADKTFGLLAQLAGGLLLGDHAALLVTVAYQQLVSGIIRNPAGGSLLTPSGNSAVLDLSGLRLSGGLQFFF